jgi:MFS family permease
MINSQTDSIWTRTFALLCLTQFLGYAQHFLLQPTFPLYITHLGGSPFFVGLVLASFAVTSVVFRPVIGYWVDRWSETGMLVFGLLFLGTGVLFCFIPYVGASMFANAIRGIGWAGMNTGGYAILAVSAPLTRRGEASGYYSGVQSSATILFPAAALWLLEAPRGGFGVVFLVASALTIAGAAAGLTLGRSLPPRTLLSAGPVDGGSWLREFFNLFEREVRLPAALIFCVQFSLPAVTSFIVLYAGKIGIGSIGSYFVVSGVTSLLARPALGRVSDKIGRGPTMVAGFLFQMTALILLITVSSLKGMLLSGVLYMLGSAIGNSTILALAMERANPERLGRALASFSVAFPLSLGLGAFLTGIVVELAGYFWMYLFVASLSALGAVLTLANWSSLRRSPIAS